MAPFNIFSFFLVIFFHSYVNRHRDPTFATSFPEVGKWPIHVQISHYATVCCRRLDRIGSTGRRQAKKPTEDEVEQARVFLNLDNVIVY